ncbi:response regulator transcription factor [Nocardioides plantarum]|uniref:LuxR C-terminal-related transcriptional regulator n=1 Tax=Nocardioides plantarum TaxID=29299 RepID=A0ABV5K4J1_9ACTN|nr:response regulator transcription factor [Nocardioides plantarum]
MSTLRLLVWHECRLTAEVIAESLRAATAATSILVLSDLHDLGREAARLGRCVAVVAGDIGAAVLDVAENLSSEAPGCNVVLVATQPTPALIDQATRGGSISIVSHNAGMAHLVHAVRGAAAGCPTIDVAVVRPRAAAEASPLSRRERDVMILTSTGCPIKEIAAKLFLTPGTVRNVSSSAIRKASARNRFEAARVASSHGWL